METQVILRRSSLAAAMLLLGFAPAHAQALLSVPSEEYSRGRNVGVAERPHPEYDPVGMPVGAFRLYPTLSAQAVHTDNVFATDSNRTSDTFARIAASFSVASDWSRNAIGFGAQVSHDAHADVRSEDSTSYAVQAAAKYEVTPDVIGNLLVAYEHGVEPRESSTSAALAAQAQRVRPQQRDPGRRRSDRSAAPARLGRLCEVRLPGPAGLRGRRGAERPARRRGDDLWRAGRFRFQPPTRPSSRR